MKTIQEAVMTRPNKTELEQIYKNKDIDATKCYDSNQWTEWNSADNPSLNDGNDFETLHDHIIMFR